MMYHGIRSLLCLSSIRAAGAHSYDQDSKPSSGMIHRRVKISFFA